MKKIGIERLGEYVHAALERQHLSDWRPASTAPCNQDLELRVSEDSATTTLPFPCRHTNGGEWINVDLGVPLQIQPVEWRPVAAEQIAAPLSNVDFRQRAISTSSPAAVGWMPRGDKLQTRSAINITTIAAHWTKRTMVAPPASYFL